MYMAMVSSGAFIKIAGILTVIISLIWLYVVIFIADFPCELNIIKVAAICLLTLLLISGIGLLRFKNWARRSTMLIMLVYGIGVIGNYTYLRRDLTTFGKPSGYSIKFDFPGWPVVLFLSFVIFILIFLTRTSIKGHFK